MKKLLILAFVGLFSTQVQCRFVSMETTTTGGGTTRLNGVRYDCDGVLKCINNECWCNGIKISPTKSTQLKDYANYPLAQSALATTAVYALGGTTSSVTCDKKTGNGEPNRPPRTMSLETETDLANNGGYFVGNYASRKLAHLAAENGYNKNYLSAKGNDLSNCLPEQLYGYTVRENARPIVQGSIEIATHTITQELGYHVVGLYLAKQCVKWMTSDNNR